jgi:pyruvate ferredoxin oxidoreductase delta subunit
MAKPMAEIKWQELEVGCDVSEPGSSAEYHTGSWRTSQPTTDPAKCIQCAICWMHCPDACIFQHVEGHYDSNLNYCKGCGICAQVCPKDAITMTEGQ